LPITEIDKGTQQKVRTTANKNIESNHLNFAIIRLLSCPSGEFKISWNLYANGKTT
jgi:hypothetical protein